MYIFEVNKLDSHQQTSFKQSIVIAIIIIIIIAMVIIVIIDYKNCIDRSSGLKKQVLKYCYWIPKAGLILILRIALTVPKTT